MKALAAIIALAAGTGVVHAEAVQDVPWTLDPATVSRVEAKIVMPGTAKSLKEFTRYYEPGFDRGHRTVFGLLKEGGDKQVHIGHGPIIMDGGCSVIELTYDVGSDTIISIACHGEA